MMFLYIFTDDSNKLPALQPMSPGMRQLLVVFGAVLLVSTAVLMWAWLIRKRRRGERKRKRHHRSIAEKTAVGVGEVQKIVEKRRRRRRERRPRNPTLAETGGLPPVRPDEPPPPPEVETVT